MPVKSVVNIDAMRAETPNIGDFYEVQGYYNANDGGGGIFHWDGSSNALTNTGTIFSLASGGGGAGRFIRLIDDDLGITPQMFGAVEKLSPLPSPIQSTTEVRRGFQRAIDFVGASGGSRRLVVPKGTYNLDLTPIAFELDFVTSRSLPTSVKFNRASAATRINDQGVIESVVANVLRYDFSPAAPQTDVEVSCRGVLIEGTATNRVLWSSDLTKSPWSSLSGLNITKTDAPAGPDNIPGSSTILTATVADGQITQTINFSPSYTGTRMLSLYIQRVSGTGDIQITTNGGTNWATISPNTSAFTRWLRAFAQRDYTNALIVTIGIRIRTVGDSFAIWGVQNEDGNVMTSVIPTTDMPVTRELDDLRIDGTDLTNFFDATQGTFVVDWIQPVHVSSVGSVRLIDVNTGAVATSEANRISLQLQPTGQTPAVSAVSTVWAGGSTAQATVGLPYGGTNQVQRSAFTYKSGEFKFALNGSQATTVTSGSLPTGLTRLQIGNALPISGGTFRPLNGILRRLQYYRFVAADEDLLTLATAPGAALLVFNNTAMDVSWEDVTLVANSKPAAMVTVTLAATNASFRGDLTLDMNNRAPRGMTVSGDGFTQTGLMTAVKAGDDATSPQRGGFFFVGGKVGTVQNILKGIRLDHLDCSNILQTTATGTQDPLFRMFEFSNCDGVRSRRLTGKTGNLGVNCGEAKNLDFGEIIIDDLTDNLFYWRGASAGLRVGRLVGNNSTEGIVLDSSVLTIVETPAGSDAVFDIVTITNAAKNPVWKTVYNKDKSFVSGVSMRKGAGYRIKHYTGRNAPFIQGVGFDAGPDLRVDYARIEMAAKDPVPTDPTINPAVKCGRLGSGHRVSFGVLEIDHSQDISSQELKQLIRLEGTANFDVGLLRVKAARATDVVTYIKASVDDPATPTIAIPFVRQEGMITNSISFVGGASNAYQGQLSFINAATASVVLPNLPGNAAGLPIGTVWNDGGTLKIKIP